MGAKSKYVSRPVKTKLTYLHELDSQADARIVMSEKIDIPLQIIYNSISRRHFITEVLYPNNRDFAIYQSCPKLTNNLFGKNSKIIIVRAFLFDRRSVKYLGTGTSNIERGEQTIENYFRKHLDENFTQIEKVKSIMTGLLAIPRSGKQKLLTDLSNIRDSHTNSLVEEKNYKGLDLIDVMDLNSEFCNDMPMINICDSFRVLLRRNHREVRPISPIDSLLSADFSDTAEFEIFRTKVMLYESGTLKLYK